MESVGDKFENFDQKLKKHGVFEKQQNFMRSLEEGWAEKVGLMRLTSVPSGSAPPD